MPTVDERFLKEDGLEVFTGNELLFKGALENEVSLITGYPGSPVSDIFDVASANRELLKKRGILAEMANNEALAVARLNGARMAGVRAMAVMKSVGLHVAADGLALGNLSEPSNVGGSIVVVGDDPWIDSTQVNNDSRYLSQHLHMPVLEPSTFQEMKDWIGVAFELSSRANLYLTYLITTNQADGGGTVWAHPNRYPSVNTLQPVTLDPEKINLDHMVLLPPKTWAREETLPARFEKLVEEARARGVNRFIQPSTLDSRARSLGFITSGLPYCYLEHALRLVGLEGRFPILKLGLTYPVDPEVVLSLAERVDAIYVIEEKRGFVESQVIQILHEARQRGELLRPVAVWGKKFPEGKSGIPSQRGLNTSVLLERLIPLFLEVSSGEAERQALTRELALLKPAEEAYIPLPVRTPTFCPGCPHRDSSSVFLEIKRDFADPAYMGRVHRRAPVDLIFHGETGCFTMLMFEPNQSLMHNYSGMGLGGGTGAGLDPFVSNKQIVFLGDSTFFHSGMVAVSDSIKSGQDITYVILDNKTTAMTGHQPTAGTDRNVMGETTFAQNIETIVRGMGEQGVPVTRMNPGERVAYRALLEDTVLRDGVKIVIADKECGLTYHRQRRRDEKAVIRRQGYLPEERHINVTPEVCEFCLACTNTTGCPGLTVEPTLYGPKIAPDLSSCVSDGACAKVKACPAFEEVIVHRRAATPRPRPFIPVQGLPEPALEPATLPWYGYIAGVGGMGAGLLSAILVRAAHAEGYRVLFADKKGLAVRNGGVYAHLIVSRDGGALAPLVPYGKADLLLGIDLLEAARACDPKQALRVAHPDRTHAVLNAANHLTVRMLMGQDATSIEAAEKLLRGQVRPEGYWSADLSALSEKWFDSKLYANLLLLGAAYQRGHLPFALSTMTLAIEHSVRKEDRQVNLEAFHFGRALVWMPEMFDLPQPPPTYSAHLREKVESLRHSQGDRTADAFRFLIEEAVLELGLEDEDHLQLVQRAYDLVHYENLDYARRYLRLVLQTAAKDRRDWGLRATRAVLLNAQKVMAIKDEFYVAHLLTSPEKRARDRQRYRFDESHGDRVTYRHFNRPEITLFGKAFRADLVTRDWQLELVKRLKPLRRWIPGWHVEERDFRDWYLELAFYFDADTEADYDRWVQILKTPEEVRGYREIRRPTMEAARRKVDALLRSLSAAPPRVKAPYEFHPLS